MQEFSEEEIKELRGVLGNPVLRKAMDVVLRDAYLPTSAQDILGTPQEQLASMTCFLGGYSSAFSKLYIIANKANKSPRGIRAKSKLNHNV